MSGFGIIEARMDPWPSVPLCSDSGASLFDKSMASCCLLHLIPELSSIKTLGRAQEGHGGQLMEAL